MVKDRMDVVELLRKEAPDADLDFLREGLRVLIQAVMEAEVATKAGASFGERSSERITYRNSYWGRPWDTRVGALELEVPKEREGRYFPSMLEPRRRSERALLAVLQQAYVKGVSTRRLRTSCKRLAARASPRARSRASASSWAPWSTPYSAVPWTAGPAPVAGWCAASHGIGCPTQSGGILRRFLDRPTHLEAKAEGKTACETARWMKKGASFG